TEAVARAAGVPAAEVRRAHLLAGSLPLVAQAALSAAWPTTDPAPDSRAAQAAAPPATDPAPDSRAALSAAWPATDSADSRAAQGAAPPATDPAPDSGAALAALRAFGLKVGRPLRPMLASSAATVADAFARLSPAIVEWKIDGIRIQVHRAGADVAVFTRTLDDITIRVPEITAPGL